MNINRKTGVRTLTALSALSLSWSAFGAGYKLPETSTNATALSAAYIANASGPDASYYNPAGMALNEDGSIIQADLTLVHLPSIKFRGTQTPPGIVANDESKTENIPVPTMHYVSPYVGNARFGLSLVSPGGLSKRWGGWAASSAEEFTLKLIEVNPTIGYRLSDNLAVAAGARMVYTDGVVKSGAPAPIYRDLEGDSIDFGYNLAIHYEPNDRLRLAATYRSKVDLTVEGSAKIGITGGAQTYDGDAKVTVPLPASLALAAALDMTDSTTIELVVERTYWSSYEELDFDYDGAVFAQFDNPLDKDWDDVMTYRFGLTHQLNDRWTLMAGFALDESPAPKKTIGFELPESDGKIYSLGARYKVSDQLQIAGGVLYTKRDKLNVTTAGNDNGLNGEFSNAGALLVSVGGVYRFH